MVILSQIANQGKELRGLAYGQPTVLRPMVSVLIPLSGGLLGGGLAVYLFNWDSKNRARRGHPLLALLALAPYLVGRSWEGNDTGGITARSRWRGSDTEFFGLTEMARRT